MADELLSFETTSSRADVASMLHAIADEFDDGETLRVSLGDQSVSLAAAESYSLEFEIEREPGDHEDDSADEIEIEIEIEWREPHNLEDRTDTPSADERERDSESEETANREAGTVSDDEQTRQASESLGTFQLFEDRAGEWRWRLVHRNGNIIATSGEGYTTKQNAKKGIRSVLRNAPNAEVTEQSNSPSN
ncbi:HVO_2922 family protein [Halostagnicola sp. A-GB9-2]|uniref:HVO_2922 family protein n=1 Tax=Halostagnicola sp. A-GB9-2 TaxID=3048066 RepID=UPI0024BFE73A|nr:HVO_2922 family protein [Halostagnicola sp. A-GB9-2]MDJ1431937.1 DUF1508 domain-containing protein [Halostagnicola sp. A-GB9-2]